MGDFGRIIGQGATGAAELYAGCKTGSISTTLKGAENVTSALAGEEAGKHIGNLRRGVDQFSDMTRVASTFLPSNGSHPLHQAQTT